MVSSAKFLQALKEKCTFKKIPIPNLESIEKHQQKEILIAEWENMLKHQLPDLKPFNYYWEQLPSAFNWLSNLFEEEK